MTCFLLSSLCDGHHFWHTVFWGQEGLKAFRRSVTILSSLSHIKNLQDLFHKKSECLKILYLIIFYLAWEESMSLKGHAADINSSSPGKYHNNQQGASAWITSISVSLCLLKLNFIVSIFFEHLCLKKYFNYAGTTLQINK